MLYYGKIFFFIFSGIFGKIFPENKKFFFNPLQYLYTKIKLTLYKNPLAILQKPPKNQAVKKLFCFFNIWKLNYIGLLEQCQKQINLINVPINYNS